MRQSHHVTIAGKNIADASMTATFLTDQTREMLDEEREAPIARSRRLPRWPLRLRMALLISTRSRRLVIRDLLVPLHTIFLTSHF